MTSRSTGFTAAYLSVFALPAYFQLNWIKMKMFYPAIFPRLSWSFLLTLPILYLVLQIVHIARSRRGHTSDIRGSLAMLHPFAILHLEWIVYVSYHQWRYSPPVIFGLFAAAMAWAGIRAFGAAPEGKGDNPGLRARFGSVNRFIADGITGWYRSIRFALGNRIRLAGLDFYPVTWVLLTMQGVVVIRYCVVTFQNAFLLPLHLAATALMPVLLVQGVVSLTSGIRAAGKVILGAVSSAYFILTLYHLTEDTPFDYSILHFNRDLLSHSESYAMMMDRLRISSFVLFGFFTTSLVLMALLRSRRATAAPFKPLRGAVSLSVYLALTLVPLQNMDQIRSVYRSVMDFRRQESSLESVMSTLSSPFPYEHPSDTTATVPERLPNIILICLESCNGLLIEKKTEEGREITPFFNSLIPRGVYIERYYGNSIQTARAFFSLLTGVPAGFRKKESTSFPDLAIRGLPAILSEYGYRTFFMKAYHDLSFDNTGEFMRKAGFEHVGSMTEDILTEEEKANRWGWGLQDDFFYRKCFSIIDEKYGSLPDSVKRRHPLFLTTFNVSHHMLFQDIPENQEYLYPGARPEEFRKNFRNSMFVADSCLREVFAQIEKREWLHNSLIVVVGDHGFPSGDHSIKNEKGAWDENFRTPFLMIWEGRLKPGRLTEEAYSHVDFMPTLFDVLDFSPAHHAIGSSVFAQGPRPPLMLSQPYDGIALVSIDYPYKLVEKFNATSRQLFDLARDPMERTNLIAETSLRPIIEKLQRSVNLLKMNQALIERNRLWPRKLTAAAGKMDTPSGKKTR